MRGKKVLVVGGTGFLGYHLIKRCLRYNMKVISISRKKPSKIFYLKKVDYKIGNLSNSQKLKKIIKSDYNFVVNFGGNIDHNNKKRTYSSHYLGVKNLYEALKEKKIDKFIQIGSSSEYGKFFGKVKETDICKPKLIYGKSKLKTTKFLINRFKKKKFPIIVLRFFQVYGPLQKKNRLIPYVIHSSLKDKRFKCSEGSQLRDFLYIDDAINSIFKIFQNKKNITGKIFNIGSGKPIKVKNLILMIKKLVKKGKPVFGVLNLRIDESMKIYPELKKAKNLLKWKSRVSLNKGLEKSINYYRKIK